MSGFHKRAITCELCGQQFFPSSLPFHLKSCVVKQQYVEVPCPHCDEPFRQCELQHHILKDCRKKGKLSKSTNMPNECAVCGRRFAADRLVKHQAICRRNSLAETVSSSSVSRRELVAAAVEELATPINSNWREKRDELKRRIGESRKHISSQKDAEFQLVLKDHSPQQEHQEYSSHVLDDSLEIEDNSRELSVSISPPLIAHSIAAKVRELSCEGRIATVAIHASQLAEKPGSNISKEKREPLVWTVDWPPQASLHQKRQQEPPGNQQDSRAPLGPINPQLNMKDPRARLDPVKPQLNVKDSSAPLDPIKAQLEVKDPRARLDPVKFEFTKSLTRTTSSFTIPTRLSHEEENTKPLQLYFPSASIRFN